MGSNSMWQMWKQRLHGRISWRNEYCEYFGKNGQSRHRYLWRLLISDTRCSADNGLLVVEVHMVEKAHTDMKLLQSIH